MTSDQPQRLRLTHLGELARLYGVQTSPDFWRQQWSDVNRVMEFDGDWEQMLQERIEGLEQLLHDVRDHGLSWFAAFTDNEPSGANPDTSSRPLGADPAT